MKRNREILEKAFPKAYIESGLNATQAYKKIKTKATYNTARVEGPKTLAIPAIRKEIETLLAENDLSVELALKTHRRNMLQDKHLPTSQKAVEDIYHLTGMLKNTDKGNTQIAIIIEK